MIQLSENAIFSALKILSCDVQGDDAVIPSLSPEIDTGRSADMHKLVEEAELIEAVLEQFHSVVQQHIVNLRRRRNQLLPFYRLPPELVIRIIETLLYRADEYPTDFWRQDLNIPKHYSILTQLSQVSFYWRNIILSRNLFWNKIDSRSNVHFSKLCLQRAKDAPLDIVISEEDAYCDVRDYRWMWDYCSRWRSFYSENLTFSIMDGRWMEAGATPLLESFHTKALPEACREVHDRDLPPAVKSQASRLVHLGTDYYGPPIELGCLSRLRTISFVPLYQDEPLTQSQWHALLSSAPLLSNIKIDATGLTDRDSTDVFTSPIHMPELRELIVIKPPLTLLHALLGAIVPAPKKYPLIKLPQYRRPYPRVTIYESQAFAGSILSKLQEMDRISTNINAGSTFHTYNGWHGNDKILMNEYTYISDLMELSVPSTGFQFLRSLEIPIINLHNERGVVHGIRLCLALENLVVLDDGHVSSHVSSALLNLCMSLAAPLLNQPCKSATVALSQFAVFGVRPSLQLGSFPVYQKLHRDTLRCSGYGYTKPSTCFLARTQTHKVAKPTRFTFTG
ncbi:hypothetical protein FRC03_007223 [Tulasnella sp. 419]|nr:hypothetical protein FRC03_007223 [Tulasnella sp. 419]